MPKAIAKPAVTSVPFSTRLDPVVSRALATYCATKGASKVSVVDKALRKLLKLPAA
jgi:hypothetical protein